MVTHGIIEEHLRRFYDGHVIADTPSLPGPTARLWPQFHILTIEPGPRIGLWSYVTVGAFQARKEHLLEFVILAQHPSASLVELLAMATYYHHTHELGHGHTIPIGRSWIPGATCDHLLVSTPYPLGYELEICETSDGHLHVLWLLPITESERNFKMNYGLEQLEQKFEEAGLEYWQVPKRVSSLAAA